MFGRVAVATTAHILYASLTAGVSERRGVHSDKSVLTILFVILIAIVEGREAVVDGKRVSTGVS